ncbi:MAG: lipopolysaccharide biosynthesis protein [Bacteroidales bacterium]
MRKTVHKIINSEFLRNLFTLVSATSVAQAIALAIYPVLTRIYTPAEHGLFALYMSIVAITGIISTGKYELAVMIPKNEKEGRGLIGLSIILSFLFSLILLIFIFFFKEKIPQWLGNPDIETWLYFIPLSTFMVAFFQTLNYWNNRKKQYKAIATANLGQSLVNSTVKLSTSSAISAGGGLITGAISGQFAGMLIYLQRLLKRDWKSLTETSFTDLKAVAKKFSFFPRYNMLHYLTNNFSSNLPVFIFSSWFSSTEVGLYSLGFLMINRPMNLITTSLTQVFSQRVIEKHNKKQSIKPDVMKLINRLFLISVIPFIVVGIFGPSVYSFVFGSEWLDAGKYMRLLLPWLFLVFLSSPLSFLPDMLSFQKKAMWIDIVKFLLRILALSIGVIMNDIYLSIALFSGISFILVLYTLFWYLNLSAKADENMNLKTTG